MVQLGKRVIQDHKEPKDQKDKVEILEHRDQMDNQDQLELLAPPE